MAVHQVAEVTHSHRVLVPESATLATVVCWIDAEFVEGHSILQFPDLVSTRTCDADGLVHADVLAIHYESIAHTESTVDSASIDTPST